MPKTFAIFFLASYVLGAGVGLLAPQYKELKDLQRGFEIERITLSRREEYISHLESRAREIDEHQDELNKVDYALPPYSQVPWLAEFLARSLPRAGMVLKDIGAFSSSVVGDDIDKKLVANSLKVKVEGGHDALLRLLKILEESACLIEVDKILLSPPAEEYATDDIFEFILTLRAHSGTIK